MKANDYKAIKAWGKILGSFDYYIKNEQEKVAKENAPINAIYRANDRWHTTDDIVNPEMKKSIEEYIKR